MSTRAMKALLSDLGEEVSNSLKRPAEPRAVMEEFCRAMSVRKGRPIELKFHTFPPEAGMSGVRLDFGGRSLIVVEAATAPAAQFVILGHELWHEEDGNAGHHTAGMPAAARTLGAPQSPETVRRAVEQILDQYDASRESVLTVTARAHSADDHEVDAETFGLLFGRAVRTWMTGEYAQGPVSDATIEGRINLSLLNRGGRLS
ncbi:toxin [Streptomyces sp. NPDC005423]|uniref:toxin n=1 Tax=Streptomyces sp. NPDC005423 TaxID=3155343 RepID=UPI0033AABBCB